MAFSENKTKQKTPEGFNQARGKILRPTSRVLMFSYIKKANAPPKPPKSISSTTEISNP